MKRKRDTRTKRDASACSKALPVVQTAPHRISLLESVWLAALVTIPSVVNPFAVSRYDSEKALLLRAWGTLAAMLLLIRAAVSLWRTGGRILRGERKREALEGDARSASDAGLLRSVYLVLAAWVGVHLVSARLSLVPGLAWFGGYSRGAGGVWSLLACSALFIAVALECRSRVRMERLLLAVVLGSLAPTVAGLVQVAGVPLFAGADGFPENRPWSTFGNAIAFGSYLTGVIPAACYCVWRFRRWGRVLPAVLIAVQVFLLYRTGSRGPIVGLGAAAGIALLLMARGRGWRNAAIAGAFALVTLVGVFLGGVQLVAHSEAARQKTRTGMMSRYNTVEVRILLYRALTERMSSTEPLALPDGERDSRATWRPWIGFGPECLAEPLLSRLTSRFERVEGFDRYPDSTHSKTMDVLGSTGLVGLGIHLLFATLLLRVTRRALGFRLSTAERWLCGGCLLGCSAAGVGGVVFLWGTFAWALGLLVGVFLGIVLAVGVAIFAERRQLQGEAAEAAVGDRPASRVNGVVAVAGGGMLFGLWVESQFGIPLVSSSLLYHVAGGLLVAMVAAGSRKEPEAAADVAPSPLGGWVAVGLLTSSLLLLTSTMDNFQALTDWTRVLWKAFATQGGWIFPSAALLAALVAADRERRWKALPWVVAGGCVYLAAYASELSVLRVSPLRSIPEILAWGNRMQAVAWFRVAPLALLPAVLVLPCWRRVAGATAAGAAAFLVAYRLFWPGLGSDILLATAQRTAELGEPRAALEVVEKAFPSLDNNPHAAHFESRIRLLAVRAARATVGAEAADAAWDVAIGWARQAVATRPLLASYHGELAGVMETAARETINPSRARIVSRDADKAYERAVALAPGLNVHRRRLAGLRLTLRKDAEGCFAVLHDMLAIEPDHPVALTMLAKQSLYLGKTAEEDADARLRHFTDAALFAERAILSPTARANRVNLQGTRNELKELRAWFDEQSLPFPELPAPAVQKRVYVPPRMPEAADRTTLRRIALASVLALFVALGMTPVFRRIARSTGFVDAPAARKLHVEPTPLLGGAAILCAVLAGVFTVAVAGGRIPAPYPAMLGVASGLALVGLVDDRRPLHWSLKLLAQIAAAVLLWKAGVRVQLAWLPHWVNVALTLSWLVGITNAVNFLDNMNGLSTGLSALAAGAIGVLGILNEGWEIAFVAMAVVGACLGFLRYNHHRGATIFMGDTGSLFLGSLLASLALLLKFPANHNWVTWLCPVLLLAVPVFDMTHVCLARLRRGKNPFSTPGKDHTSHLLARMGFERHGAVLAIHAAVLGCGIAAGVVAYAAPLVAYGVAGLVFAAAVFLLLYFELRFGRGGTETGQPVAAADDGKV